MPDTTTTADTTATTTTTQPWHTGVDAETLGFWQNKGLDLTEPVKFANGLTKIYRDAEKHIGAPPDQLLRLPKADAKPEDIKAFHQRLGVPAEAKEYDFSAVKIAGQDLPPAFTDAMRNALHANFIPKDRAAGVVAEVAKFMENEKTQAATVNAAKVTEEKATLQKNWGDKFAFNQLQAMEGAKRLGISPDGVKALEGQIGYSAVMEAMRKIGANTREDTFVERGVGESGVVTTREGAVSRKAELMADTAWRDRYLKGGAAEKREMDQLLQMIDGEAA